MLVFVGGFHALGSVAPSAAGQTIPVEPGSAFVLLTWFHPVVLHNMDLKPYVLLARLLPSGHATANVTRGRCCFVAEQDTYRQVFHFQDPPLHDPCAVAFVADPALFKVCSGAACTDWVAAGDTLMLCPHTVIVMHLIGVCLCGMSAYGAGTHLQHSTQQSDMLGTTCTVCIMTHLRFNL